MFILRDMALGGLLGSPFTSGPFKWHGTNDECRTTLAHGLEYRPGSVVLQRVYRVVDLPATGDGSNVAYGELTVDEEGDRVTRTVTRTPTINDVRAECSRRLSLGFDYDFGDARGVHHIGTSERDMKGWDQVSQIAIVAVIGGNPNATIHISTDTGECDVAAAEWLSVLAYAAQVMQPIWQASFGLQSASPIPADFKSDSRWQ